MRAILWNGRERACGTIISEQLTHCQINPREQIDNNTTARWRSVRYCLSLMFAPERGADTLFKHPLRLKTQPLLQIHIAANSSPLKSLMCASETELSRGNLCRLSSNCKGKMMS